MTIIELKNNYARNVRFIRKEYGLNQTEFGTMTNVPPPSINAIERGGHVNIDHAYKIVKKARIIKQFENLNLDTLFTKNLNPKNKYPKRKKAGI